MDTIGMGGRLNDGKARSVEWYTPPHIFDRLGLKFDLDPCTPTGGIPWIPAKRHFSCEDDGLHQEWSGRVWLNPPYGREASRWVDKLVRHKNGVALVFARVDAKWSQRAMRAASAVCLIEGRLSFIDGRGGERHGHNAACGSMLLAFGEDCATALHSSNLGLTFRPVKR